MRAGGTNVRNQKPKAARRWLSINLRSVRSSIFTPKNRSCHLTRHRDPTRSLGDCQQRMESFSTWSEALTKVTNASREKASYPASSASDPSAPISARSRANFTARARVRPGRRDLITCSKDKEAFNKAFRASRAATTSTSSAGRLLGPMAMRTSSSIARKRSIAAAFGSPATLLIFLTTARRSARSAALT